MKYVLIIGDGMADNPVPALGGKTPLEYADIPTLDRMAAAGDLGNVRNVPVGLPAGSDTAILSIFGCDPRVCYTGRAPLEVAAAGIALEPGEVAMRCNMVAYEDGDMPLSERKILSHSAGSIEGDESIAIVTALFEEPEFKAAADKAGVRVYPSPSFRHFAVQTKTDVRGLKLTPPHDHLGEMAMPLFPTGCENAKVLAELMELAFRKLDRHPLNESRRACGKLPANGIWFWAEGTAVELPSFVDKYHKSGAVISAVPLCQGIARLTGLDVIKVPGATGELTTNYAGKVAACLDALKTRDFAAVHLEAPDECTHNGDTSGKLQAIENLDRLIISPILDGLAARGDDVRMLVLSDHKTLTSTRGHDGDPVPFVIYDSTRDRKSTDTFCERCGEAGPTLSAGTELMGRLFGDGR